MSKNKKQNYLAGSLFSSNYDELPESKKEILNEKYNCAICFQMIKREKPFFCYVCQKIFHIKCLKNWDSQLSEQNKILTCPFCKNVLPLEFWQQKLGYEDDRYSDAIYMSEINDFKKYKQHVSHLLKDILQIINEIYSLINSKNIKIVKLFKKWIYTNYSENNISNNILKNLKVLKEYIRIKEIEFSSSPFSANKKQGKTKFVINFSNPNIKKDNKNNMKNNTYRKEINLKYINNIEGYVNIFGKKFVEINKDNIELIIKNKKNELVSSYKLEKGENNIKMIINNKINNLSHMFDECKNIINIDELKFLDTKDCVDFSYMFNQCSYLSDIKSLQNWDVSNGKNFSYMFSECTSLSNIEPLQNWNVRNGTNFSYMFNQCPSLANIESLGKWNVQNGKNFSYMFKKCSFLYEIKDLNNWNYKKDNNYLGIFSGCLPLLNLNLLKNWNVSSKILLDN